MITFPLEQGTYQWTSGYGYRTDPLGRSVGNSFHGGVDLAPRNPGTPSTIHAPVDGTVTVPAFEAGGAGNNVWVLDAGNILWKVFHMARIDVHTGQHVKAGDPLGIMGTTGASTGIHAHVERWQGGPYGTRTDPTPYLREAEQAGAFPGAPTPAPTPPAPPAPTPQENIGMEKVKYPNDPRIFLHGFDRNGEWFALAHDYDPKVLEPLPTRVLATGDDDLDARWQRWCDQYGEPS